MESTVSPIIGGAVGTVFGVAGLCIGGLGGAVTGSKALSYTGEIPILSVSYGKETESVHTFNYGQKVSEFIGGALGLTIGGLGGAKLGYVLGDVLGKKVVGQVFAEVVGGALDVAADIITLNVGDIPGDFPGLAALLAPAAGVGAYFVPDTFSIASMKVETHLASTWYPIKVAAVVTKIATASIMPLLAEGVVKTIVGGKESSQYNPPAETENTEVTGVDGVITNDELG